VPALPPALEALSAVNWPVLQSSANHTGGDDARSLDDVPAPIRAEADLVLDGGELPGTPSTVVDLSAFETTRDWSVVREGALARDELRARLSGL
jgi:L-threonylcarbamoyladenylate synthase